MFTFKVLDLLLDSDFMTQDDLKKYPWLGWKKDATTMFYSFNASVEQNRYLLIYCEYDTKAYREKIYDMEQELEADNPRKPYQNELRQQFFACYDTQTSTLYLSDFLKKNILQSYIKEQTNKEVRIRERFDSIDGFCGIAKFVKSVRFIQRNSLMNSSGTTVFNQMYGALGLDIPNRATTKIEYGNLPIESLKKWIGGIKQRKDNCEFDSVVIVGMDAYGAEVNFSYESLVANVSIDADRNENGRYDSEDVFSTLISAIEVQNV